MNLVCTWLSIKDYHLCCLNNLHTLSRCHGPISPPNPEFTLKPTKKKMGKHIEFTPGTPCPPCKEVVLVPCFGQHLGQERAVSFLEQHNLLVYLLPPGFSLPCVAKHILHFHFFQMPCCKWRPFACENLCGNPLLCGNHYCTKSCHVLEVPLNQPEGDRIASISKANTLAEPCEQCNLRCQRVRYSLFLSKNFNLVCFTKLNMKKLLWFRIILSLGQDID